MKSIKSEGLGFEKCASIAVIKFFSVNDLSVKLIVNGKQEIFSLRKDLPNTGDPFNRYCVINMS